MKKLSNPSRRLLAIAGAILLILLFAAPAALAFEGYEGERVIIDDVVEDDVYASAGRFVLNGTIKGDLVVFANTIEINGAVEGDIWALGQTITIEGTVGDDARIAGYAIAIEGEVEDDLIVAGYSLENDDESIVGGDLVYVGFQALIEGTTAKDLIISAPAIEISGDIGGSALIDLGETSAKDSKGAMTMPFTPPGAPSTPSVPLGLDIDEAASIGGDLDYSAGSEFDIPLGVVAGEVTYTPFIPDIHWLWNQFVRNTRRLITLLIVGALMMWLLPSWTRELSARVRAKPLPSLGWGVVALLALAVALTALVIAGAVVAMLLGFWRGAIVSAIGFSLTTVLLAMTQIVISLVLGQLILRLFKSSAVEHRWWPLIVGAPAFVTITALFSAPPGVGCCLGTFVWALVACLGLGAIWIWGRERLASGEAAPAEEDAPPS
jgi:hypothetical protein